MTFARHETFHFREGWLTKGLRKVETEGMKNVFLCKDAMDLLGIGSNMVKSLRYWMLATNLTQETTSGKKEQSLTSFGQLVYECDRYFERDISLWLLHYHIAKNKKLATTWYWFFNVFNYREFDEALFLTELTNWVKEQGENIASGSLKKDYDCLVNMYVWKGSDGYLNPEDNIGCPLQDLRILELVDAKTKRFRFTKHDVFELPKELYLFMILNFVNSHGVCRDVSLDALLTGETSVGRIMGLGLGELLQILEWLQEEGLLYISKTAGLNHVSIKTSEEPLEILKKYYFDEGRGL